MHVTKIDSLLSVDILRGRGIQGNYKTADEKCNNAKPFFPIVSMLLLQLKRKKTIVNVPNMVHA